MGKRHKERFETCDVSFSKIVDSQDESFLDGENPDFVVVASPARTHYQYVKICLERKVPVFVEKPLAVTGEEAQSLVDLAEANDTLLFVAQSECFNPLFLNFRKRFVDEFKEVLAEYKSSQNVNLRFRREHTYSERCRDVNVALDMLVHDLSLFLTLFKYENIDVDEHELGDKGDMARISLKVARGEYAGVQAYFYVDRNSEKDVRNVTAEFPDAEFIISLARHQKNGEVVHSSDSLDNEQRFFLKLLSGVYRDWGRRLAQVSADAVKIASLC